MVNQRKRTELSAVQLARICMVSVVTAVGTAVLVLTPGVSRVRGEIGVERCGQQRAMEDHVV